MPYAILCKLKIDSLVLNEGNIEFKRTSKILVSSILSDAYGGIYPFAFVQRRINGSTPLHEPGESSIIRVAIVVPMPMRMWIQVWHGYVR